jgi:hypothetical protein
VQLIITVVEEAAGTLVRVDGWLAGEGVPELVRVLDSAAGQTRLLLHDLRGADAAGISVLRQLEDRGVPLDGLSTYIRLMLASPAGFGHVPVSRFARPETPVRRRKDA